MIMSQILTGTWNVTMSGEGIFLETTRGHQREQDMGLSGPPVPHNQQLGRHERAAGPLHTALVPHN